LYIDVVTKIPSDTKANNICDGLLTGSPLVTRTIPRRTLVVNAGNDGTPVSVSIDNQCIKIRKIVNSWVINSPWKSEGSSRQIYFECQMTKNLRITVINDHDSGSWFW
jgi:hypothetical protein